MVGVVNLNLTVDRIHIIPGFTTGTVVRPVKTVSIPGGKGVNVARVLNSLGSSVELLGFVGGTSGNWIQKTLNRQKIHFIPVTISGGETRTCTLILDPKTNTPTVINERGPEIHQPELHKFVNLFSHFCRDKKIVVITGSLPPGVPLNFYFTLIQIARKFNTPCVLDTSGPALEAGIKATPIAIKPNLSELGDLIKIKESKINKFTPLKLNQYLLENSLFNNLINQIHWVIVSLGKAGTLFYTKCKGEQKSKVSVWYNRPPKIKVVNSVGSGDALVAGFVYGWLNNLPLECTLRISSTCAVANILTLYPGELKLNDLHELQSQVKIYKLK